MLPILILAAIFGTGIAIAAGSKKTPPAKAPPPIMPAPAPPTPAVAPPAPVLDNTLAPAEAVAVQKALASVTSPSDLIQYAATLRPASPQAATQLEARAKTLAAQGVKG
jgi:hypothetical protein